MVKPATIRQRRSGRVPRQLPIQVSGIDAMGRNFSSPARTVILSRYGAEIVLRNELVPNQEVAICLLGNLRDWDARVVGMFSARPEGFSYGIEFLFQDANFWGISFPPVPTSTESPNGAEQSSAAEKKKTRGHFDDDIDFGALLRKARTATPLKNYVIRLKCQHLEAHGGLRGETGEDDDQWLILQDRHESLQKILETAWDFACPIHGAQREFPLEAKEAGAGFQIHLPANQSNGPSEVKGRKHSAKAGPKARRETRIPKVLRVWVRGLDLNGNPFRQSACSIDISRNGGRLEGLGLMILSGTTIELRRNWRKALFRVVWTGKRGTPQASQIGILCLEPSKNVWNIPDEN